MHREFGLKFWAFVSGGGTLPGPLEQFWNALGFVLVQGYGMTETTALITLNHPFHVAEGTIGKPLAGTRGQARSRRRSSCPRRHDLRRHLGRRSAAPARRRMAGDGRHCGAAGVGRAAISWAARAKLLLPLPGVNIHPEDIEAAIEEQPDVAACAVVAMETRSGPEPCAVLACRGSGERIEAAIERANARLAEFQRISRWVLWPEPDLPRTSTGKVRRKPVAAWLARIQAAAATANSGMAHTAAEGAFAPSSDWLLALIAQITGEAHPGVGDELRLTEDLHLDSLGRVQLSAAIEERLGIVSGSGLLEEVQTLGELRRLVAGSAEERGTGERVTASQRTRQQRASRARSRELARPCATTEREPSRAQRCAVRASTPTSAAQRFIYPVWPWWKPVQWIRVGVY